MKLNQIYFLVLCLVLGGCVRNELDSSIEAMSQKVHVTLEAEMPAMSKVTFDDGGQLVWESTDSISLIIGNQNSRYGDEDRSKNNSISARLMAVEPGVFDGLVDMGTFGLYDIRAAVYPHNPNHHYRRSNDSDGTTYNLGMQVGGKADANGNYVQTQKTAGVLNGENIALFTLADMEDVIATGDDCFLDGQEFQWASAVVCFNIFGKALGMEPTDVLKSIVLKPRVKKMAGYYYYIASHAMNEKATKDRSGTFTLGAGITEANTITLNLEEGVTLADKNRENGVKLYMSLIPLGKVGFPEGAQLVINTDRTSYVMNLEGTTIDLQAGQVRRIAVDLSDNFPAPYEPSQTKYSVDGSAWQETIPETFSTLYVSGGSTPDILQSIKTAVDRQEGTVSLDFSSADYESKSFPAIFCGTADAPDTKLVSIRFPSNIIRVDDGAFLHCHALSDVDLTKIVGYGDRAFQYTALRKVHLDKNVTMLGQYVFANCYDLEEIYFNVADPVLAETSSSTRKDYHTFEFEGSGSDELTQLREKHTVDLVATIGPDTYLPRYAFMNNANLTRLVFEYNGAEDIRYGNNALHFVHYLKEIVFKGTQGCVWVSGSSMSEVGMSVTGHKLIVVPAGCLEKYQSLVDVDYEAKGEKHKELYTKLVDTFGYVMCEEGNVPEDPKPQISYSVDGSSWSDALPSSFATLHAKTRDDYAMTSGDLVVLKNAIAGQAAPVVLDLSEAVLETETFPATFMASVDEPNTSLKSVVFPSNVTAVESGAFKYCEALESMDLEGVTFIGSDAFRGTGLKKVDVPSSVLSVGDYSFSYLPAVEEIYYNSPFDKERHENNYMHAFCNRNNTDDWNSAAYPMVFTAGPEAKVLGRHFFDTNAKLVELIIEGDDVLFGQEWAIRAYNLKRIEFKVGVPSSSSLDAGADLAKHIGANQGRIVCPDGKYDEFAASPMISALVATGKFVLKEKSKEFEEEEVPPAAVQYSEDGIEWSNDIPSEFSSLHLKTNDEAVLTASVLTEVAGMIARQSSPVSLYLGDVAYESETFPAVFKAAEDSPNTSLKSIIFPSNITVIDDEAFFHCAALESVDLGNIVDIGDAAFRYSGLKSVRIDKQVTKMGRFSFGNCYNMTEAYFNVPVSNIPTSSSTANNWHVFGWETQGLEKTNDFTLTIGPDSTLPRYMCADNHNLVKLILEYDGTADREFCNNALNRTWYLATVVCHGKTGQMLQPQEPVVGEKVTGTKYLVVPDGCTDAYKNHTSEDSMYHKFCCEFTYKENNVEKTHNNGFRIIEQSAYDAL